MLCAIIKIAFALTCLCHITLAALRLQMLIEEGSTSILYGKEILSYTDVERRQTINFISHFAQRRQIVIQLPDGRLPEAEDADTLNDYLYEVEPETNVRLVLVNFFDPNAENTHGVAILKKIEYDEMMGFYRLLMELKKHLQSQVADDGVSQDFVVLTDWGMEAFGVPALFALPSPFASFYTEYMQENQTNHDIRPKFDGYYFIEWEHMWRYLSTINPGVNMVDQRFTLPAEFKNTVTPSSSEDDE